MRQAELAAAQLPCLRVKIVYNYGLCGIKKMCFAAGADRRGREVGPELLYKLLPNGAQPHTEFKQPQISTFFTPLLFISMWRGKITSKKK